MLPKRFLIWAFPNQNFWLRQCTGSSLTRRPVTSLFSGHRNFLDEQTITITNSDIPKFLHWRS